MRVENCVQRIFIAIEIRNQHLDATLGIVRANLPDRLCPMRGTSIGEVIAINRSDYGMGQVQLTHRFSDMSRFLSVEQSGLAFADRTKSAVSCANVAA